MNAVSEVHMKEQDFYQMCDIAESSNDETNGYFPTVDELKAHHVDANMLKYMALLFYYASDPFTRLDMPDKNDPEYQETVKYAKKLLYGINLEVEQ